MNTVLAALTLATTLSLTGNETRPDIIIMLTDQQQASAMGITGNPHLKTPAMDQIARDGVRFTHAFCATPQCSPARGALWTGLYPHRTGVMGNVDQSSSIPAGMSPPLNPNIPSIGTIFAHAGYETAYFGKWHLGNDPGQHGFQTHDTKPVRTPELSRCVLEFLHQRDTSDNKRPLLMIVSWINPHDIYHITKATQKALKPAPGMPLPASLKDDLSGKPLPQKHFLQADQGYPFSNNSPEQWRQYLAYYYRLVEKVDAEIGTVTKALRAASPNALLVFTSDHGDLAGAHGLPFKGPAMYEELVRIPFLISWPGHIQPAVRDQLVSHLDLLPTLCDLAHVTGPDKRDGQSLRALLLPSDTTQPYQRDAVFAEYYGKQHWRVPIRMIRTPTWKYVLYRTCEQELYDLSADPNEMRNLAPRSLLPTSPDHAATGQPDNDMPSMLDTLTRQLREWQKTTHDNFDTLTFTDREGRQAMIYP